jgi:hypothetical protein
MLVDVAALAGKARRRLDGYRPAVSVGDAVTILRLVQALERLCVDDDPRIRLAALRELYGLESADVDQSE